MLLPLPGERGVLLLSPHPAFGHLLPKEKELVLAFRLWNPSSCNNLLRFGL